MLFPSFARSSSCFSATFFHRPAILGIAFLVALAAACSSAAAQTVPPPTYTITKLGTLPGDSYSVGYAINESGDVAGYSVSPSGQRRAVLFKDGKVIDLGLVSGANASAAYGINGYDQVTGEVDFPESQALGSHAFLYSGGKMQDIGTPMLAGVPPEYNSAGGTAINDSGQIAVASVSSGSLFGGGAIPNVYLYSAGAFIATPLQTALSLVNPYTNGMGNNINASGQIAGTVTGQGTAAIFNSSNGSTTLIGSGQGSAINDSGQATGATQKYAFLYSKGTLTDIIPPPHFGLYSYGDSINAAGQIVGVSGDFQGDYGYPFLYTPGQGIAYLPSLPDTMNLAINDKGQIVAYNGNTYLLSPVFVPFSTLDAVVDITGPSKTTFAVGGRFTLGAKSDGIDLTKETAVLQLGGYHISLPPSSFVEKNGIYTYHGKIGNVTLQVVGRQVARDVYLFGVVGQGAAGLPKTYPLNLVLTIGNDTGSEVIKENYGADNLTEAEVCRNFGLTCAN